MNEVAKKILITLDESNLKKAKIEIIFKIQNNSYVIRNKDIMGSIIQSWFEVFLTENNINWKPRGSQEYPDFILDNNEYLELKCYFKESTPAFDVANFSALINDLPINPKRLDSGYLIFNYGFNESEITLNDYWIKKIWEITSPASKNAKHGNKITAQVTRGIIKNIRPLNFPAKPDNCFPSRRSFVKSLKETIDVFSSQSITSDSKFKSGDQWFDMVSKKYKEHTNKEL